MRRHAILDLIHAENLSLISRGTQALLAETLGVHPSTISRDMRGILAYGFADRCPLCGALPLDEETAQDIAECLADLVDEQ